MVRSGSPSYSSPSAPLGPASDRAGVMEQRAGRRPAGEDEAVQLRQIGVELVAPALEPGHVVRRDSQRGIGRIRHNRIAQIGADIEQIVLYVRKHGSDRIW